MNKPIRNIKDLTASLVGQYEKLLAGEITPQQAKAASSVAGKILSSCMVQMHYASREWPEEIPLLGRNIRSINAPVVMSALPRAEPPELTSLVALAIERSGEPLREDAVAELILSSGQVEPDYFDRHAGEPGGKFGILRGTLLGLFRSGVLLMERDNDGHAVFSKVA